MDGIIWGLLAVRKNRAKMLFDAIRIKTWDYVGFESSFLTEIPPEELDAGSGNVLFI